MRKPGHSLLSRVLNGTHGDMHLSVNRETRVTQE